MARMHKNGFSVCRWLKHIVRYRDILFFHNPCIIYLKRFYLHLKQCIFYFIIAQAKDSNLRKLAYGGSLGRLNHHGRTPLQMRAHHHNHHGSTTLSNQLFKTTAAAVWIQSTKCKKEDLTFYCHENNVLTLNYVPSRKIFHEQPFDLT